MGNPWNDGRPRSSPRAWKTPTTPGIDSAPLTSTDRTVPCATGERTYATYSMSVSTRSST
jgi:hypothetical protein